VSTIDAVLKFFDGYPFWAKIGMLAGLVFTFGIAVLAHEPVSDTQAQTKPPSGAPAVAQSQTILKIYGLNGPKGASARVSAFVNGSTYLYPSLGAVDWLDIGPTMSPQSFPLPEAKLYNLRFEVELQSNDPRVGGRYVSQETLRVSAIPQTGEYRVFKTRTGQGGVSRDAVSNLSVKYALEKAE